MAFTYKYSQPDEYKFSLDSVLMPELVANDISKALRLEEMGQIQDWRVLDLCSGCGVVGFELSYHLPELRNFDFVEVQEIYLEHFNQNLIQVGRSSELCVNFHNINYEQIQGEYWHSKFDVIVANPPYFKLGQGKLSPSEFKNRCRFFIDSDFEKFLQSVLTALKPLTENKNAAAYVLVRNLADHKLDQMEIMEKYFASCGYRVIFSKIADVRGTDLFKIQRY